VETWPFRKIAKDSAQHNQADNASKVRGTTDLEHSGEAGPGSIGEEVHAANWVHYVKSGVDAVKDTLTGGGAEEEKK
jgi:hypothetical protein